MRLASANPPPSMPGTKRKKKNVTEKNRRIGKFTNFVFQTYLLSKRTKNIFVHGMKKKLYERGC